MNKFFENEADVYAKKHSDLEIYVSALSKISKYEEVEKEISQIDAFFQSHPSLKDRIYEINDKS